MSEKPELTFEQFASMCEDAGIQAKPEELEQDYRTGAVLADVVDEVMEEMEANPPLSNAQDSYDDMVDILDEMHEAIKVGPAEARKSAVELAAMAIRFASDLCHDEAAQN